MLNDLGDTVRMPRKSPLFTFAVVLTVALSIGAWIVAALALSRVLASLVFDVPVRGPLTYVGRGGDRAGGADRVHHPRTKGVARDPMVALRHD